MGICGFDAKKWISSFSAAKKKIILISPNINLTKTGNIGFYQEKRYESCRATWGIFCEYVVVSEYCKGKDFERLTIIFSLFTESEPLKE